MTSSSPPTLLSIVAHARSGALDHAWRLFEAGGYDAVTDDPAVLTVRGRLLKDRALTASGKAQRELWQEAARAYGRAGEIQGVATYPFINAATLLLLAGDAGAARGRAAQVLDLIERGKDGPETSYYRAATRAEALLLLGRGDEARAALAEAVAQAPRAWEDHASTLRQFGLILEAMGADPTWLDAHRPPRSLHFAGHMAVSPESRDLSVQVAEVLARERIGFGYGALAAGADIIIAEALLAHGAELHLVLPAAPEAFNRSSVAPFGAGWAERFAAVLSGAETVRVVGGPDAASHGPGNQLAAEVAMGEAVMQAGSLMSEAVQLLVLDQDKPPRGEPGSSAWVRSIWNGAGRRQRILVAPRASAGRRGGEAVERGGRALAALVSVQFTHEADDWADDWAAADRMADDILPRVAKALSRAQGLLTPPRWSGGVLTFACATPGGAAAAAQALAEAMAEASGGEAGVRIAAHYGVVRRSEDPFGGEALLLGSTTSLPGRILGSTPPGAIHVSGDFAAALHAGPADSCPRTEYVGDLPTLTPGDPVRLHALRGKPA